MRPNCPRRAGWRPLSLLLLTIALSACGSAEKAPLVVSAVPQKSEVCETWRQIHWSVDDTAPTSTEVRRNNRAQASYCNQK